MITYLLILILLVAASGFYDFGGCKAGRRFIYYTTLLSFILLAGLRYRLGLDSLHYEAKYENYLSLTEILKTGLPESRYQILWILFCSLCKELSHDFLLVQIILSALVNFVIFDYIKKTTPYLFSTLITYFLFFYLRVNTEVLRESLAICIFLLSLKSFKENRLVKYYSLILIATQFHLSALICLTFPIIKIVDFKRATLVYLTILVSICVFVFKLVSKEGSFLSVSGLRPANYFSDENIYNLNGVILTIASYLLIPSLLIIGYKERLRRDYALPMVIIYLIFGAMTCFNAVIFQRFLNYATLPFFVIFFKLIFDEYRRSPEISAIIRLIVVVLVFSSPRIFYFFVEEQDGVKNYSRYFPYTHIWDQKIIEKREYLFYKSTLE
ncbi:EpsG family protein [Akkermansiaceae bacterium]|nr:EpsG family protein [Akkermansiaceae bacterium]